jgi:hypothetical protein
MNFNAHEQDDVCDCLFCRIQRGALKECGGNLAKGLAAAQQNEHYIHQAIKLAEWGGMNPAFFDNANAVNKQYGNPDAHESFQKLCEGLKSVVKQIEEIVIESGWGHFEKKQSPQSQPKKTKALKRLGKSAKANFSKS